MQKKRKSTEFETAPEGRTLISGDTPIPCNTV